MPRWARRRLGTRVMSWSNSRIVPLSGASSPVMRLNKVVLPAPFGPMINRRSPGSTAKPTSAVTRRPPQDFGRGLQRGHLGADEIRIIDEQQPGDRGPETGEQERQKPNEPDIVPERIHAPGLVAGAAQAGAEG